MAEVALLEGRVALVTGGAGGLGRDLADALANAGARVMVCDRHGEGECDGFVPLARKHGDRVAYLKADLSDPAEVRALIEATHNRLGSVDILVNNAVVRHFAPLESFPLDAWNEALAVNLTAALVAVQAVLPGMRAKQYGRIFNMTSVFSSRGTIERVDYVTTKTALHGLTRAIAMEVAGSGVSCHALTPGSTRTPGTQTRIDALMTDGLTAEAAEARFLEGKQPSRKFVDPASVAAVMLLLCGPAGIDMNGAELPIEGGWLARS